MTWVRSEKDEYWSSWRSYKWSREGYHLEYRYSDSPTDPEDPGWYLFGPDGDPFGEYMERHLEDAKSRADLYIENSRKFYGMDDTDE